MSEWLVVLLGLIGMAPAPPEPQPEATVTPVIELTLPEMLGADRRFIRFADKVTGAEVQRMIMRNDVGFAVVDYRDRPGGHAMDKPWKDAPRTHAIRADRTPAPASSRGSDDLDWRFLPANGQGLDCLAIKRPVRLREDPGNAARVVEADVAAMLCAQQGMITEHDVWRVSQALKVNDPGRPLLRRQEFERRLHRKFQLVPQPFGGAFQPRPPVPRRPN